MRKSLCCTAPLLALALTAIAALWRLATPAPVIAAELDFPPTDYTIRSLDGSHVIGHAHFSLATGPDGLSTIRGEYRFLDGDYDIDEATVRGGATDDLPVLVRSHHSFFHADGSRDRESQTDVAAGTGACIVYENGQAQVSSAHFDFPADTYAGAAVMLPLRHFLRARGDGTISFHDFNCIPGPKILKVSGRASPPTPWPYYPGNLVRVDVKPDFGWINVVIAPFLPQIRAWFDPADGWFFVGGESARYYKGTKYLMVRARTIETQLKAAPAPSPQATIAPVPNPQPTPHPQPSPESAATVTPAPPTAATDSTPEAEFEPLAPQSPTSTPALPQ